MIEAEGRGGCSRSTLGEELLAEEARAARRATAGARRAELGAEGWRTS